MFYQTVIVITETLNESKMKTLKVGDKIKVINSLNFYYTVTITRVTKTMAIGINSYKNEERFRINYHEDFGPDPLPRKKWETRDFKVL